MPETIRVLIAEDQSLVRGALVALLETCLLYTSDAADE